MKKSIGFNKLVLFMVLLITMLSVGTSKSSYANKIIKEDNEANYVNLEKEDSSSDFLIKEMDEKIEDLVKLIEEIEEKKKLLEKLERVQKYVNMDITSDLDKVKEISDNTPLDFETAAIVVAYAEKFDLKPSLILGVIKLESNFNKWEVGSHQDRGYMQIIPSTEKWLAEKYGDILGLEYDPDKIFDPEYNIGLGCIYLNLLQKSYGNDIHRILSEYNRGPYKLKEYYEKNKTYATAYSRGVLSREERFKQFNETKESQ